jgi:pyruvate dehydrogenase (quinone)
VELQPIDFAGFAHACGGVGYAVDDPAQWGAGMDQFLSAPGPAILEAVVDPLEARCRRRSPQTRR